MINDNFVRLRFNVSMYLIAVFLYPVVIGIAITFKTLEMLRGRKIYKRFNGEIALITGGAGGLGKNMAIELAKLGCHIAIVDVKFNEAETVANMLHEKYNVRTKAYKVDITDYEAVQSLEKSVVEDLGTITVLINNAGIILFKDLGNPDPYEVQQLINLNITSHFWTLKAFLPKMRELRKGHIVAISSIAGLIPLENFPEYTCSKYAVRGLMYELRCRLKFENSNIQTTTVYPPFLQTHEQAFQFMENVGLGQYYPAITGEEMAERIIRGMQENQEEVTLPITTPVFYRMFELLPAEWRTWIMSTGYKAFDKQYDNYVEQQK